jgi:hypothetical protein
MSEIPQFDTKSLQSILSIAIGTHAFDRETQMRTQIWQIGTSEGLTISLYITGTLHVWETVKVVTSASIYVYGKPM